MERIAIVIAVMALALAACQSPDMTVGHEDEHAEEAVAARVVDVNLYEFGIDYMSEPFEDGEVITFRVLNTGLAPHEFEVTSHDAVDGHMEGGHDEHSQMAMTDKLVLDPGEQGELTVTIGDDFYLAVCLIPGHYEAGMWIALDA
jgi:uncharacterized cupredoxin-like copper-binding protein